MVVSSSRSWLTLILLTLFMLINFWDRTAFGFAGTAIMRDLRLSHAEFGLLAGAFFWLFSPSALAIGWLADRWPTKWIVGSMALLWAVAQALMSIAGRVSHLFLSRLLLGVGEGPAFPNAIHVAYSGFPSSRRAMVSAFVSAGVPLGVASGALLITALVGAWGWRAAFLVLSLVSTGWALIWLTSQRRSASTGTSGPAASQTPKSMTCNSTTIGVIVAAFCVYWVLALSVNWFPAVLQVVNGLSSIQEAKFLAAAWALQIFVFPLTVRFSGMLTRRRWPGELVFAAPAGIAIAVSGTALMLAGYAHMTWGALACIALSLWCTAVTITCLPPIVAEITPAHSRGTALGVFAAFSSTAGIFGPLVFGRIVDAAGGGAHGYRVALLISGALLVVLAPLALALMKPTRHGVAESRERSAAAASPLFI